MKIITRNIKVTMLTIILSIIMGSSAFSQSMSLKAGAARVDITPAANPEYPPSGKYDVEKLNVRAIVLDNGVTRAALIGADVNNIYDPVWESAGHKIAKELDCPVENIIMSSTHTHSGRTAGPPPAGQKNLADDTEFMVEAIMKAVSMAKAELKPARVGFGTGALYLNVNRDVISKNSRLWTQAANPEGPSDKTLAVVMFSDLQGTPIATYVNYAMHPINGYLSSMTLADYPGAACRYVEKAFGDDMVMIFCQGASGDQNPLWIRPGTNALSSESGVEITGFEPVREDIEGPLREGKVPYRKMDPGIAENLERWMEALGTVMGEETIRVMTNISNTESDVRIWGAQEIISLPGRKRTSTGREGYPGTYEDGPDADLRLGLLGIGNIALTSIDAEVYNIIAQKMKKASPMTNTVMVTIANGKTDAGYIISDDAYGRNTFQVLGSKIKPGYAEEAIVEGLVKLINQYSKK